MIAGGRNRHAAMQHAARGVAAGGALALAAVLAAALTGCGGAAANTCSRDEDCASHFCRADGTCAPAVDGGNAPDGPDATPGPDGPPVGCTPNHDGTITADELPLAAGQTATFRIATDATIDTAGQLQPDGSHLWSLDQALSNDADRAIALESPTGQWWAADFPDATYATLLSTTQDLRGVFKADAAGLHLLGVVSPSGGATRTELTYDPAVDVLQLPLQTGSKWTSQTTVSGLASGIAAYYTESYDSRVDAVGTVSTPYGDFPVLRVAVDFSQTVGAVITTHKTFAFVSECYGTVATITSKNYETKAEFTSAAEVWRLAP